MGAAPSFVGARLHGVRLHWREWPPNLPNLHTITVATITITDLWREKRQSLMRIYKELTQEANTNKSKSGKLSGKFV